jgi:HD-GYP domain-containing protein (c-di-GMP phosphodiesterase class II)
MSSCVEFESSILLIESEINMRSVAPDMLPHTCKCDIAASDAAALELIRNKEYAVIIWGHWSGRPETPQRTRSLSPVSSIVLASSVVEESNVDWTLFDFVERSGNYGRIRAAIEKALALYELRKFRKDSELRLEELVALRTADLDRAVEQIENAYSTTLRALIGALEARDLESAGHSERVVTFSLRLGFEMGLDKESLRNLELGALLHDVGKIGVPDSIIRKPARLTDHEWERMRLHPMNGERILRNIQFLEGAVRIVSQHHERWDGTGYPLGLRGEEIDAGARIFAAADAFDAMISSRVYRLGRSISDAIQELEKCSGTQFDPVVIEAFRGVPVADWEHLRSRSLKETRDFSSFQSIVAEMVYSKQQFELVH